LENFNKSSNYANKKGHFPTNKCDKLLKFRAKCSITCREHLLNPS